MLFDEWQSQRALLNHDILCNQLRTELVALRVAPQSPAVVRLKMWPRQADEYRKFFDLAIDALSPQQVLNSPIFATWDETRKDDLGPIVHEVFLALSNIAAEVQELHESLSCSVGAVEAFLAIRPTERTPERVAKLQELLDSLSQDISALPREIGGAR